MPVPDFQSLMLPVLKIVASGDTSTAQLREKIAHDLKLTESEIIERLPSGSQTVFGNRVAWAIVYLQRAGLIEKAGRGLYRISGMGRKILDENPSEINLSFLQKFPGYTEWRRGKKTKYLLPLPQFQKNRLPRKSKSPRAIRRLRLHWRRICLTGSGKCRRSSLRS